MFSTFYSRIQDLLDPGENNITARQAVILCLIAYLFGVLMRSFYLWNALDIPSTLLDGVPMISTEDGYLFVDYVNSYLKQDFSRISVGLFQEGGHGVITALTYLLVRILPFTLEQVAVFMPMFFAPLLAIPTIYACRWLGNTAMGFFAALIVVSALPYLRRSSFAYFDTDLFALTAPVAIVALGIYAIRNPGMVQILLVVLMAELTRWLDKPQIAEVIYIPFFIVYVIVNFRHPKIYQHLILMCTPFMVWTVWYKLMLYACICCGGLYTLDKYKPDIKLRVWQVLAAVTIAFTVWQSQLYDAIQSYIGLYGASGRGIGGGQGQFASKDWNFYKVTGTIVEARSINLFDLSREISGFIFLFWLGLLGAILAIFRFPVLAAGGTFLGIGLFALEGGIRFGLYLVPIIAIGNAYLIVFIGHNIHKRIKPLNKIKYLNYALGLILVCFFVYPGAKLAYNQSPRTVAQLSQVQILQRLDAISETTDYILSWWDYGYVMSFYSDMRNLINGAKHHEDNYIISKAMSSTSQRLAANIMREAVEAYEEHNRTGVAIRSLLGSRREGFNSHEFINSMASSNYQLRREKTREIFVYLPYQMLPIYGVVRYFSDLNLNTGKLSRAPLIATRNYRIDQQNQKILLPNGVVADLKRGVMLDKGNVFGQINSFHNHQVGNDGKSKMLTTNVNSLGYYHIIVSGYYGIVYVMGAEVYRSNFVQMFFFNKYDPELFELIERNSLVTTYRLKI